MKRFLSETVKRHISSFLLFLTLVGAGVGLGQPPNVTESDRRALAKAAEYVESGVASKTDHYLMAASFAFGRDATPQEWASYASLRKLEFAYHCAAATSRESAEAFLSLMAENLARDYPTIWNDEDLRPFLGRAMSQAPVYKRIVAPSSPLPPQESQARVALLALSQYLDGSVLLTSVDLLEAAGFPNQQAYEFCWRYPKTENVLTAAVASLDTPEARETAVRKMILLTASRYPTAAHEPALGIYMPWLQPPPPEDFPNGRGPAPNSGGNGPRAPPGSGGAGAAAPGSLNPNRRGGQGTSIEPPAGSSPSKGLVNSAPNNIGQEFRGSNGPKSPLARVTAPGPLHPREQGDQGAGVEPPRGASPSKGYEGSDKRRASPDTRWDQAFLLLLGWLGLIDRSRPRAKYSSNERRWPPRS